MPSDCITESCPKFWDKSFEIGKGGNGTIYSSENCPTVVLKLSNDSRDCKYFKIQYDTQLSIYNCFNKNYDFIPKKFFKRVCILKPSDFTVYKSNNCSFKMRRIFPFKEMHKNLLIQAFLGQDSFHTEFKNRGLYLGKKEILNILKKYNSTDKSLVTIEDKMNTLISDLGTSMAIINLICGLNGLDIEIILGKPSETSNNYKLYIIDFDKVEQHNFDIENLIWPYESEPYYPLDSEIFWRSYCKVARSVNKLDFAKKLIDALL